MIKQAISPLRRRMIEDMEIRGFAAKTQRGYIRAVRDFTAFLDRSPDQATAEDLRRHQLEMRSKGASATSINAAVSALRFFFSVTLGRDDARTGMTTVREPRKLPVVLSPDEVARLLDAAPGLKYKAAFSVAYGAGLRASEVVSLKLTDIDGARQVIRVEQGKGRRDRYAMLSDPLLDLLRAWWREARPQGWLFPGRNPVNPLTTRQLRRAFDGARQAAQIDKKVSLHTLRHCFATLSLLLTRLGAETLVFWVPQPLAWLVAPKNVTLMTRRGDLKLSHGATAKARENTVKQDRVQTTNAIKSPGKAWISAPGGVYRRDNIVLRPYKG